LAIGAQSPENDASCPPDPSWPDRSSVILRRGKQSDRKIRVEAVSFESAHDLPERTQSEVREQIMETPYDDPDYASYAAERVKEALQEQGYYYADVGAQSRILRRNQEEDKVSVTFYVAEGLQYRLGGVQFVNGLGFPPAELRAQIPLEDGDVFDLGKVRMGIDALAKLYGSIGYINFTAKPELQVNNAQQTISVRLELEEDKQFRVGTVQVYGLDPKISVDDLRIPYKPGDIINANLLGDFYRENQDVLPAGLSPRANTHLIQGPRSNTVTIVYDVRACRAHPE